MTTIRERIRSRTNIGDLVRYLFGVDGDEIDAAVDAQANSSRPRMLGEMLVHRSTITPQDLDRALDMQRRLRSRFSRQAARAAAELVNLTRAKTVEQARRVADLAAQA